MRYPASEKLEIIQLVERSHLPVDSGQVVYDAIQERNEGGSQRALGVTTATKRHCRTLDLERRGRRVLGETKNLLNAKGPGMGNPGLSLRGAGG